MAIWTLVRKKLPMLTLKWPLTVTLHAELHSVSYLSEVANFNLPHLQLAQPFWVTPFEFRRDLIGNWSPWAIVQRCLRDPTFSRFDTIPACDGQADGWTDRRADT